jgi:hypothetical protein
VTGSRRILRVPALEDELMAQSLLARSLSETVDQEDHQNREERPLDKAFHFSLTAECKLAIR